MSNAQSDDVGVELFMSLIIANYQAYKESFINIVKWQP